MSASNNEWNIVGPYLYKSGIYLCVFARNIPSLPIKSLIIQFPWQTSPRSEIRRRFLQPLQCLLPALTFRRAALEYGGRLRQDEREGTACSSRRMCYRQIIRVNDMVNVRAMIFCQLPFVPYLIRRTQELRQGFAQATGAANQSPNRPISARASRLVKAGRDDPSACRFSRLPT